MIVWAGSAGKRTSCGVVVVTICIVLYFCRISVTTVNVAVQFLNDPLCWRASRLIAFTATALRGCSWTGNHRSVWFIFGSGSSSPRRYLGITHSFKVTRKRLKCLENAFPAINFSKLWASRLGRSRVISPRTPMQVCNLLRCKN